MSSAAGLHAQAQRLLCWLFNGAPFIVRQKAAEVLINEVLLDALPATQSNTDVGQATYRRGLTEEDGPGIAHRWDILCLQKLEELTAFCKTGKSSCTLRLLHQAGRTDWRLALMRAAVGSVQHAQASDIKLM